MTSNGEGKRDDGAEFDLRKRPCIRRTWCVLELDHDGSCTECPRTSYPPPDLRPGQRKDRR